MIRVRIEDSERDLPSVSENWINQQVHRRKAIGQSICVRVIIREERLNMTLSSAGCPQSSGGGRPPNRYEKEVFDLWEKRGLNRNDLDCGNLLTFLKELKA